MIGFSGKISSKRIRQSFSLLCGVLAFAAFVSCTHKAKFTLESPGYLSSLSETGPVLQGKKGGITFFRFTKAQRSLLDTFFKEQDNAAIVIRLAVKKAPGLRERSASEEVAFYKDRVGFLYPPDFKRSSLRMPLEDRPLVSLDFGSFEAQELEILLSLARGGSVPEGFFINSAAKYSVLSASVAKAAVGFDFSAPVPRYAFAPNGGILVKGSKKIDFSGLSLCLPPRSNENAVMPVINLVFDKGSGGDKDAEAVKFSIGGERFSVRNEDKSVLCIPAASLKSPYSVFEITESGDKICSVMACPSETSLLENSADNARSPLRPIKTDPGLIVLWPRENWRGSDYEIFEWDRFDGVLFFDTASYSVQNDFFRRLAFFVEKQGYKGRLLTDSELEGKHGYNAHDYRAYDLARFFERARVQNFPLNRKELLLCEILEKNGIIVRDEAGSWTEGRGAVISISKESPVYLRTALLAHEGWHGIFFVDKEFRDVSATVYYSLAAADPVALNFLVRYFQVTPSLNYDTGDDYLMKNEFMAYMLQRPVRDCEKYFTDMAGRVHAQTYIKEEADHILSTRASGLVGAAQMLDDYVSARWGLSAGRVWLLSR